MSSLCATKETARFCGVDLHMDLASGLAKLTSLQLADAVSQGDCLKQGIELHEGSNLWHSSLVSRSQLLCPGESALLSVSKY